MLNKYDFKYILKRVIVFILIGFISANIGACKAHAFVSTMSWNFSINLSANEDYNQYLFNFRDLWTDKGTGFVYFNINYKGFSGQGVSYAPRPIKEMYLIDSNNYRYECILGDITSYWDSYVEEKNISVKCPIDFVGSTLRGVLIISPHSGSYGAQTYNFSEYATFVSEDVNNMSGVQQSIDNVNNSINNSSVDTSTGNNSIDSMQQNMANNGTISSLIVMPITLLQKIINTMGGTCSSVNIGELFGSNFVFPCINPQDYIGIIWNIIDAICCGFLAYSIGKRMVVIFNDLTNLKDGGLKSAYD